MGKLKNEFSLGSHTRLMGLRARGWVSVVRRWSRWSADAQEYKTEKKGK